MNEASMTIWELRTLLDRALDLYHSTNFPTTEGTVNEVPMTVGELRTLLGRAPADLPIQLSIGPSHEWLSSAAWDNLEKFAVLVAVER